MKGKKKKKEKKATAGDTQKKKTIEMSKSDNEIPWMNFYFQYYHILGLQKTVDSPLGSKKKYFCSSAYKNVILILETKSRIDLMADDDKLAWLV